MRRTKPTGGTLVLSQISAIWNSASKEVRFIGKTLPIAGGALLTAGIIFDLTHFWGEFSFLVNMTSSVAAACFGVPFVLLFLGWLTRKESDAADRRLATAISIQFAVDFESSTLAVAKPGVPATVRSDMELLCRDFEASMKRSMRLLTNANAFSNPDGSARNRDTERYKTDRDTQTHAWQCETGSNGISEVASILRDLANETEIQNRLIKSAIQPMGRKERANWIMRVRYQWEALERNARPRLAVCGYPWISTPEVIVHALGTLDEVAGKRWEFKEFRLFHNKGEMNFTHILNSARVNNAANVDRIAWIKAATALCTEAGSARSHFEGLS
ncbi:hypothetical protein [Streptomyces sp. NBC_00344]|uniref:hypothetical protein n=1 Tax=Streptomyces sp. NBC_00344 TaxID=2975720 RepID=UPI002E1DA166